MRIHQCYYFGILIHLCESTLAAPSHTLSSLQLPNAIDDNRRFPGLQLPNASHTNVSSPSLLLPNVNTTLISLQLTDCVTTNATLPIGSSRHSLLPSDPYSYEVPNTHITVTTYSYVAAIPEACARICISKANRFMLLNVRNYEELISRHLKYSSLSTDLTLNPWSTMTWDM